MFGQHLANRWEVAKLALAMRYAEPSIIEALCEFVFAPSEQWDLTVFGRFDANLQGRLPHRDQIEVMALNVRNLGAGIEQAMAREPRVRFFSSDRTRLAQVGTNLLSANVLPPYPHWPEFRSFILECLRAYIEAARPSKIDRMTLRYIDRLSPDGQGDFRLGDWVEAGSTYVPRFLVDSSTTATSRVQKSVGGGTEVVSVVLQADDEGRPFVVLDTELVTNDVSLDPEVVGERLDVLHRRVTEVFEACITDKTRALLKPEAP